MIRDLHSAVIIRRWNHKFLDYEIETCLPCNLQDLHLHHRWNHKFLDYEIETTQV